MIFPKKHASLFAYSLFDFATSAFTLIFHAYLFPLYLKESLLRDQGNTDLLWGILLSVSALSAAVVGPILGHLADRMGRWRVFVVVATLSFASAILLALVIGGQPWVVLAAFAVANTTFYLTVNLYNSLLNTVAIGSTKPAFSGFAWGFGYIGGIICFLGVYFLQNKAGLNSPLPYLFTSAFYAAFGVCSLFLLRRPLSIVQSKPRVSYREILAALNKTRIGLLCGYFLVADTIAAVISFTSLYASEELHLSTNAIGGFLLGVQILAIPLTYFICRLAGRVGVLRVIGCCVAIWSIILLLFAARVNFVGLIIITCLTAMVVGSTQALMRSHYSDMLEKGRDSELFGWYGIATESAAVVAPLLFGVASITLNSKRLTMGLLIIPLCLGFILIVASARRFIVTRPLSGAD